MRGVNFRPIIAWGLACVAAATSSGEDGPTNWGRRKAVSFAELRQNFAQPDMIYAPFFFWFWDEPLNPRKAAEMARAMLKQRMNPGYAHARMSMVGTPDLPREQWLSKLWFDTFEAVLWEAERAGGYFGYCDEYWWPSGQAADRVLEKHPDLWAISLNWKTFDVQGGATVNLPESFFTVAAQHAKLLDPYSRPEPDPDVGHWVWHPDGTQTPHRCYFRKLLEIPPGTVVVRAPVKLTADDNYTLYVNGRAVAEGACAPLRSNWANVPEQDVGPLLRSGRNVIAIEGENSGGPYGLLLGMRVELPGGETLEIRSDETWLTRKKASEGWLSPDFDSAGWVPAKVVAEAPDPPWDITGIPPRHLPATIRSDTLQMVGAGDAFAWQAPADGTWRVYSFTKYYHPGVDGGRVNYLDERLADAFLELAHEPYAGRLGARMGRSIPGVFVDHEGSYGYKLAWSETLARRYRERTGRDIRDWIPLLFDEDAEGRWGRARWEWFDVVSDIYAEYFGKVSEWLEHRGMYCISNLWEENLMWQAGAVGDFFKAQRAFSMPGTDSLGLKVLEVHDFKETQSVTEFEARRFQSEIMGAAGWSALSPVTIKRAANSAIAWGVSHIVPHGVFMTRKLDGNPWVPDWYQENPLWPYLHLWADFVRRACFLNSHGRLVPEVLLLNPMDSVWALAGPGAFDPAMVDRVPCPRISPPPSSADIERTLASLKKESAWWREPRMNEWFGEAVHHINKVYSEAIDELTAHRVEYLIADRYYMRQMAVRNGRLVRGDFAFKTLILPPMAVLPLDVAEKIVAFAKAGGCVYVLGELPRGSTDRGMNDPAMEALMNTLRAVPTVRLCKKGLRHELEKESPGLVSQIGFESGEFELVQLHRRIDGRDFFWLVNNTGRWQQCTVSVRDVRGEASIWDCETGEIHPTASSESEAGSRVALLFKPYEAYWLVFDRAAPPCAGAAAERPEPEVMARLDGQWQVRIVPMIQPPLEHPIDPPPALKREEGDERPLQPWERWGLERFSGYVDYEKTFAVEAVEGYVLLDLGDVRHIAEVWVNGRQVGVRLWPPFTFDLTDALRPGQNRVRVRVGNLVGNSYAQPVESGLLGPVDVTRTPSSRGPGGSTRFDTQVPKR